MSGKTERHHFHSFDAFRFFAFLKVFLLHIPVSAFAWFNYAKGGGGIGVQFFFVLSGFLITYIILEEKQQTGSLNLKNFFIRRILRIWPLYYLMVTIAYLTPYILEHIVNLPASSEGYEPKLWMSFLFLENYQMMLTHQHANVSPLSIMWSLCIEEHFYIIWGVLLYYINIKTLPKVIIACILIGIVSRAVYVQFNIPTSDILTNIDLFAYGAIPAYLFITRREKIELIVSSVSRAAKIGFIVFLITVVSICSQFSDDRSYILLTSALGILFSVLIVSSLPAKGGIRINDGNLFSRLGVYTYGLYLYHILVINLLIRVFEKYGLSLQQPWLMVLFILISLLLSIGISIVSYHLFEKQFLKLKKFFR
jgi:peptidoglycan/LPS O-acetylase OafA/YrhL